MLARGYLRIVSAAEQLTHFILGTRSLINRRSRRQVDTTQTQEAIAGDVAKDVEAMIAEEQAACATCGRVGFWSTARQVCDWCIALALQQRLDALRARGRPAPF